MTTSDVAQYSEVDGRQTAKPLTHYAWLSLLRAYGVILVLGYHFFPWLVPGGFIGVDVFFVFSGYLITSLLINEFKKQGKVKLLAFYKRRFRRLFPALLAMLLIVLPLALTIPTDFRADIARQVAAVLSWTTNFYEIAGGQSYANALLPHLFVHTWTLSIEMQFYLVWGLVLTVLLPLFITTTAAGRKSMARSRKVIASLAAVLAIASFVAMQIMLIGAEDPSAAYYSTLSHAYPILIGSIIGALAGFGRSRLVVFFERLPHASGLVITIASLLAIGLLAVFVPFENRFVYHGGLLLTSILVGLVILVGRGAQPSLQQRQEPRVLQYLADRSYSLYLFHWPLMIIVTEWAKALFGKIVVGPNALFIIVALFALVLTFIVSHLCYRFVEKPFSSKRTSERTQQALKQDNGQKDPAGVQGDFTEGRRAPTHSTSAVHESELVLPLMSRSKPVNEPPPKPKASPAPEKPALETKSSHTEQSIFTRVVIALAALALAGVSAFSLSSAPLKTSIEADYQVGLLEIDVHKMENTHQLLLVTGQGGSGEGAPRLLVRPDTVSVIGDSVTIFPADDLTTLTGAVVDAEVSRAMVNGIRIIEDMQNKHTLGEYVVVALATNAHADSFESAIAICELLAPGHRLIFVTGYGDESMNALRENLLTLPERYPFVTIADWNAAISDHDDLLAADGYHLGGQEAINLYVEVIVKALEEAKNTPTS